MFVVDARRKGRSAPRAYAQQPILSSFPGRVKGVEKGCAIVCSIGEENPCDLVRPDTGARNTPTV